MSRHSQGWRHHYVKVTSKVKNFSEFGIYALKNHRVFMTLNSQNLKLQLESSFASQEPRRLTRELLGA